MTKLSFSVKAQELRAMLNDGRGDKARQEAIKLLREGYAAPAFLALVADLLEPPARGRGAPARPPQRWLEIGEAFEELRDSGATHEAVVAMLGQRFAAAERTIERAVKIYREAKADTAE